MTDSCLAYEKFLVMIQKEMGEQPISVICAAADEILSVLSNDAIKTPDKKEAIQKVLLTPISLEMFASVVGLGKLITDYDDGVGNSLRSRFEDDEEDDMNLLNDIDLSDEYSRLQGEGYEEFHIPASRMNQRIEELLQVSSMAPFVQQAFEGIKALNSMQSKVYRHAAYHRDNLLVCAPTGAGKTIVAILTIIPQLARHRHEQEDRSYNQRDKIVYLVPVEALVTQVVVNLSHRLSSYCVNVEELNEDPTLTWEQIQKSEIIVTTPTKWDMVTRKPGYKTYSEHVTLLIIDDIHVLHDSRGPAIESLVARTVRLMETAELKTRLVGLSANVPNYEDVASFLHVDEDDVFCFDNSYRRCPLSQRYFGINEKKPLQRFQLMNDICYEKVKALASSKQVLIFVHSRKETAMTARAIRDKALASDILGKLLQDSESRETLQLNSDLANCKDLRDLLPYGFAIHHAGMSRADQEQVEDLFAKGHVQVLVSTATLAWSTNAFAHTVIIKGTQTYNPEKGAWTELSPLDMMQMLSHAGRPQYDNDSEGVIITDHTELHSYISLMNQKLPIESRLFSELANKLNDEIVLGTVRNFREACSWFKHTYLYTRMLHNLEQSTDDLILSAVTTLDKTNLINYDSKSRYFQVTDLGKIASNNCVSPQTVASYSEQLVYNPLLNYLDLFSLCDEFKYVSVRQDEKTELDRLSNLVPGVVKGSPHEPRAKIKLLLKVHEGKLKLESHSLALDAGYIALSANRLLRALFEILLERRWASVAESALELCKRVEKRITVIQTPLRQFADNAIPADILTRLEEESVWPRYKDLSSQKLGELVRVPDLGSLLHKYINMIPKFKLEAEVFLIPRPILNLGIKITIRPDFQWEDKFHGCAEPFWVIVADWGCKNILHHEFFVLKKNYIDRDRTIYFTMPAPESLQPLCYINVVSDRWVDSETTLPIAFKFRTCSCDCQSSTRSNFIANESASDVFHSFMKAHSES